MAAIRAGYANLKGHMEYLGWLAETRKWLAGNELSLADFAAAGGIYRRWISQGDIGLDRVARGHGIGMRE